MAKGLNCFLVRIKSSEGLDSKVIEGKSFTLGRSLEAGLSFSNPNISRIHLVVTYKRDKVWIEDPGSSNGTFLNNEPIPRNKPVAVSPADIVRIGTSDLLLALEAIEKTFSEIDVKNAPLPNNEKEDLLDIRAAAQAEANRLIRLGQENHDRLVTEGKEKAESIEKRGQYLADQAVAESEQKTKELRAKIDLEMAEVRRNDEVQAQMAVRHIYLQAETRREEAEGYYKTRVQEADRDLELIKQQLERRAKGEVEQLQQNIESRRREFELELAKGKSAKEQELETWIIAQKAKVQNEGKQILETAERERQALLAEGKQNLEVWRQQTEVQIKAQMEKANQQVQEIWNEGHRKTLEERLKILADVEAEAEQRRAAAGQQLTEFFEQIKIAQTNLNELQIKQKDQTELIEKTEKEHQNRIEEWTKAADFEMRERRQTILKEIEEREQEIKRKILLEMDEKTKEAEKRNEVIAEIFKKSSEALEERQKEVRIAEGEKSKLDQESRKLTATLNELTQSIAKREKENQKLEEKAKKLELENEELENSLKVVNEKLAGAKVGVDQMLKQKEQMDRDVERTSLQNKNRVQSEIETLEKEKSEVLREIQNQKAAELTKWKKDLFDHLDRQKDGFVNEILRKIDPEMVGVLNGKTWSEMRPNIEGIIRNTIEHGFSDEVVEQDVKLSISVEDVRRQRLKERASYASWGAALAIALTLGIQAAVSYMRQYTDPIQNIAEEKARRREEDLLRRKFAPSQTEDLKGSYVEDVIYTTDYTSNYMDPKFQEAWVSAATKYFLKNWKLTEEKTIEAISAINALITALDEQKKNIHPDAVEEGLKRMRDLESESTARMQEILGSEVRYEAFKRLEKRQLTKFRSSRLPASEAPPSTSQENSEPAAEPNSSEYSSEE